MTDDSELTLKPIVLRTANSPEGFVTVVGADHDLGLVADGVVAEFDSGEGRGTYGAVKVRLNRPGGSDIGWVRRDWFDMAVLRVAREEAGGRRTT